jgi:alkylhydroperoxidase family enzyme
VVDGPTEFDRVWGQRERYYTIVMDEYRKALGNADPIIVELCRLRMAQLLGCEFDLSIRYRRARDAGLSDAKVAALPQYATAPEFSDRERACITFAEQYVIAASGITDPDVEELKRHIGAEGFVYLLKAVCVIDQLQRSCIVFDIGGGSGIPQKLRSDFVSAEASKSKP